DALRLVQIVKGANLGSIVGAAFDLLAAMDAELAVARVAVAQRRKNGADPRRVLLSLRLAFELARQPRARRQVAESHAAFLQHFGARRRLGRRPGEKDGVRGQLHRQRVDSPDDRGVDGYERRARLLTVDSGVGHAVFVARVHDAVGQTDAI